MDQRVRAWNRAGSYKGHIPFCETFLSLRIEGVQIWVRQTKSSKQRDDPGNSRGTSGCALLMYRQCARSLVLVRHGFAEKQSSLASGQIRFKATAPPRPPRADLQSIPQAIRELLPEPRKRDPNAPPKQRRSPWFYLAWISPLFIWIYVERHFDAKPLLEKKRVRILRERLLKLQEGSRSKPVQFEDQKSLVAYLRLVVTTMLPEEYQRNVRSEEVLVLLEEEVPEELMAWLSKICLVIYQLSLRSEDELKAAETIQDSAEEILRKVFLVIHPRLPPQPPASD